MVFGVEHLVRGAEAVVGERSEMELADGYDAFEHIGTGRGVRLVEHPLVARACRPRLVRVDPRDYQYLVGDLVRDAAKPSDVFEDGLLRVRGAGTYDEDEFIRLASEYS